jgi:hypothetical protein
MGPVKIARTPDAGRYLLVYASVQAADAAEFVVVCADLITMAKGIAGGLDEVSLERSDDAAASELASSLAVNGLTV